PGVALLRLTIYVIRRPRPANLVLPGAPRPVFAPSGVKIGLSGANWCYFAPGNDLPGTKTASGVPGNLSALPRPMRLNEKPFDEEKEVFSLLQEPVRFVRG
ncbi:MAG: hypothetical protein SPK76_08780, partial [Bacteroidales bacterium]|nr:hypothetical protein [Bacteroidales bacterium]